MTYTDILYEKKDGIVRNAFPTRTVAEVTAHIALSNTAPKPFVWTKTADEILASVARFCHRISGSGH